MVPWFVEIDELGFKIRDLNCPETKREILSSICSLHDLLGFAAPETITSSALIQDIWKTKLDCDQPLEEGFLVSGGSWVNQLPSLVQLRIPRCYLPREMGGFKFELQLHISSDASEFGYGASAYLRVEDLASFIHCSFVMGEGKKCSS